MARVSSKLARWGGSSGVRLSCSRVVFLRKRARRVRIDVNGGGGDATHPYAAMPPEIAHDSEASVASSTDKGCGEEGGTR